MSFWGLLKTRCLSAEDDAREVFVDALIGDTERVGDEFLLGACALRGGYDLHLLVLLAQRAVILEGLVGLDGAEETLLGICGELDGLAVQLLVLHGCPLYSWPTMLRR